MESDELAQALRDERELRLTAERRVAELTEHVATWRGRADERRERIEHLLQERERLRDRAEASWVRRAAHTARRALGSSPPSAGSADPGRRAGSPDPAWDRAPGPGVHVAPLHPELSVVALLGDDGLDPVLGELRVERAPTEQALSGADLVVADAAGLAALGDAAVQRLAAWAARPGRVPLVRVEDPAADRAPQRSGASRLAEPAALGWPDGVTADLRVRVPAASSSAVLDSAALDGAEHDDGGSGGDPSGATSAEAMALACFDARRHHPGAAPDTDRLAAAAATAGVAPAGDPDLLVDPAAAARLWQAPPRWFLEAAARGLAGWGPGADPERGAAAARRLAMRRHAPWVAVEQLLSAAGVDRRPRSDRVAAILVSNRPDRVVAAVDGILRSRGVELELVVGLHGIDAPDALAARLDEAQLPVTVHDLPGELSLGACLNRCIAATGAPVVAKIDDDDHYGPHHLEDGLQALRYSGADLVGKGTQFTYVAGADRTVLRRPGSEETVLDGTPTGATWVLRRSLWEQVGFPHRPRRVDALFLAGARALDATVYANSRWEFCYHRAADGHTWRTPDATFLAGSQAAWDGHHPQRVELDAVELTS